jgi:hypothetical protein
MVGMYSFGPFTPFDDHPSFRDCKEKKEELDNVSKVAENKKLEKDIWTIINEQMAKGDYKAIIQMLSLRL